MSLHILNRISLSNMIAVGYISNDSVTTSGVFTSPEEWFIPYLFRNDGSTQSGVTDNSGIHFKHPAFEMVDSHNVAAFVSMHENCVPKRIEIFISNHSFVLSLMPRIDRIIKAVCLV